MYRLPTQNLRRHLQKFHDDKDYSWFVLVLAVLTCSTILLLVAHSQNSLKDPQFRLQILWPQPAGVDSASNLVFKLYSETQVKDWIKLPCGRSSSFLVSPDVKLTPERTEASSKSDFVLV